MQDQHDKFLGQHGDATNARSNVADLTSPEQSPVRAVDDMFPGPSGSETRYGSLKRRLPTLDVDDNDARANPTASASTFEDLVNYDSLKETVSAVQKQMAVMQNRLQ